MTGDAKEWEWEAFAARAFEAYEDGRRREAVHLWTCASKIAGSFAPGDLNAQHSAVSRTGSERFNCAG